MFTHVLENTMQSKLPGNDPTPAVDQFQQEMQMFSHVFESAALEAKLPDNDPAPVVDELQQEMQLFSHVFQSAIETNMADNETEYGFEVGTHRSPIAEHIADPSPPVTMMFTPSVPALPIVEGAASPFAVYPTTQPNAYPPPPAVTMMFTPSAPVVPIVGHAPSPVAAGPQTPQPFLNKLVYLEPRLSSLSARQPHQVSVADGQQHTTTHVPRAILFRPLDPVAHISTASPTPPYFSSSSSPSSFVAENPLTQLLTTQQSIGLSGGQTAPKVTLCFAPIAPPPTAFVPTTAPIMVAAPMVVSAPIVQPISKHTVSEDLPIVLSTAKPLLNVDTGSEEMAVAGKVVFVFLCFVLVVLLSLCPFFKLVPSFSLF